MWATLNSRAARTTAPAAPWWKAFERAHRGEHDGKPQPAPEHLRGGIDLAHVPQHPRPERDLVEGEAVAAKRRFGLGGADDIVPVVLVQVLPRFGDDLMQGLEIEAGGGETEAGGFLGILILH
jgi:hypothetical protein